MSQTTIPESALKQFHHVAEMIEKDRVRAEECAKARNERFNIFTTLLKEHDEVRLHTRFIHCLLDPNGLHDCGSLFLDLFFATLTDQPGKDHDDNEIPFTPPTLLEPWTVEKEASRSPYGKIDILIEHPVPFGIALENKIYGAEQGKQLENYAGYLSKTFGSDNALLLYLTIDGKRSETHKGRVPYLRISYADHIRIWLDKCLWKTCHIIPINQVLLQYREVVRQLTGKTIASNAMNQITKFILKNPDIIRHRAQINGAINSAQAEFLDALAKEVINELTAKGFATKPYRRFGEVNGAIIITPLASSNLHQMPIEIWVEHWNYVMVGIKFPSGYKRLPVADQRLLEEMNRILDQNPETENSRQTSPNEAWPTGWYKLIYPLDDNQLFCLINKVPAVTASELCDAICRNIESLEQACVKSSSLLPQS